jgi:hypothetical protein
VVFAALEGVVTIIAITADPKPVGPLIWALAIFSIIGALVLIIRGLYVYLSRKVNEGRRLGLVRFFVLYFWLIVGFANSYYLIQNDFKDASQPDVGFEQLSSDLAALRNRMEPFDQNARAEYEKYLEYLSDVPRPDWVGPQYREDRIPSQRELDEWQKAYDNWVADEKKLDMRLIGKYHDYLKQQFRLERAAAEIRQYSYFNFVYFSTVTAATVGYGDITPKTKTAKMLVTLEILLGGTLVLVYLSLVLSRGR